MLSATFESHCVQLYADMSTVETRTLLLLLIVFAVDQASADSAFEGNDASGVQNVLGKCPRLRPQSKSSCR